MLKRTIIGTAVLLAALALLFPPWAYMYSPGRALQPLGWSFILAPPPFGNFIDYRRLGLELGGIALVAGVAYRLVRTGIGRTWTRRLTSHVAAIKWGRAALWISMTTFAIEVVGGLILLIEGSLMSASTAEPQATLFGLCMYAWLGTPLLATGAVAASVVAVVRRDDHAWLSFFVSLLILLLTVPIMVLDFIYELMAVQHTWL